MNERELLRDFLKDIKDIPGLFIHKIGDTFGGHKKPADCFGTYKGRGFLLEAKKEKGKLTDYQKDCLEKNQNAGGISLVLIFFGRDSIIEYYENAEMHYHIDYRHGKYIFNDNLFDIIFDC